MFEIFYPDEYYDSTYSIDFQKLYEEGYRGVIFDIDNTLVPHGAPADERSISLFKQLKETGYDAVLLSNNKKERVAMFNEAVGVQQSSAKQQSVPQQYNKQDTINSINNREAMKLMGTDESNTIFVGDQLFTDVWGAKNAGVRSFLVKPMNPKEEIQIVLKRKLEAIVLRTYLKTHVIKTKR